jgi:hypothetical protein
MFLNKSTSNYISALTIEEALSNALQNFSSRINGYLFLTQTIDDETEIILLNESTNQYVNKICLSLVGVDKAIQFIEKLIKSKHKGSFSYA